MAKVHYSPPAARDLCDNAEYIARDKPDAAHRWVEAIEETCGRPHGGHETADAADKMATYAVLSEG